MNISNLNGGKMMFKMKISLINGNQLEGFIDETTLKNILPAIRKRRFWKNRPLSFAVHKKTGKEWTIDYLVEIRCRNIISFVYMIL